MDCAAVMSAESQWRGMVQERVASAPKWRRASSDPPSMLLLSMGAIDIVALRLVAVTPVAHTVTQTSLDCETSSQFVGIKNQQRSAQTGVCESYSPARRHVIAQPAAARDAPRSELASSAVVVVASQWRSSGGSSSSGLLECSRRHRRPTIVACTSQQTCCAAQHPAQVRATVQRRWQQQQQRQPSEQQQRSISHAYVADSQASDALISGLAGTAATAAAAAAAASRVSVRSA